MKISSNPIVVTGVATSVPIPVDSRSNPINVWGSVTDGGASTYAIQYTTSDVFQAGYNPATDPDWTSIPSTPTTGNKPFNLTGIGCNAIRLNVTTGPATVTLGPVFQSESTQGA
jgi:hypothetical protein